MKFNFLVLLLSALIPMIIGFIWYNPKVFGKAWMRAAELDENRLKGGNMAVIFGVSFLLSFFIAMVLQSIVIHQWGIYSTLMNEPGIKDPNSEISLYIKDFFDKYGNNFRTFKHGALHGTITGIMFATPILAINALFERKTFKYIAINGGYWTVTLALMGGVICAYV